MDSNQHIREFLDYYCDLPHSPEYAVMLNGKWGSGKTWFIRDYLDQKYPSTGERFEKKPYMYISLYGIRSFSEIGDEMFSQAHPLLSSKGARIAGKVLKSFAKSALKFEIKDEKASSGSAEFSVDLNELIGKLDTSTNMILVFDDIERCSIPIQDLLGYINQFVEHDGVKSILIANEVEIFAQDSKKEKFVKTEEEKERILYKRIKEKLIGRTLEVKSQYEDAFANFVAQLPTPAVKTVALMNTDLVQQIYKDSEFDNLRLLRHALWDFDRLYVKLDSEIKRHDQLISELLSIFLAYSFEIGKGDLKPKNIEQFKKTEMFRLKIAMGVTLEVNEESQLSKYSLITEKYIGVNLQDGLLTPELWSTIFTTGGVPESGINESLKSSKYFLNKSQPAWIRLWHGTDLTDADFTEVLLDVKKEWDERKFAILEEVFQVTGLFLYYEKFGIYNESRNSILENSKTYIDWLLEENLLRMDFASQNKFLYSEESYAGKGYYEFDSSEFKQLITYLEAKEEEYRVSIYKTEADALLMILTTDPHLFFEKLVQSNSTNNIFFQTPILEQIEPTKFIEALINVANTDMRTVSYVFSRRYEFASNNALLISELDWLKAVILELNIAIEDRKGKVSSINLKTVLRRINEGIVKLELTKSNRPKI